MELYLEVRQSVAAVSHDKASRKSIKLEISMVWEALATSVSKGRKLALSELKEHPRSDLNDGLKADFLLSFGPCKWPIQRVLTQVLEGKCS